MKYHYRGLWHRLEKAMASEGDSPSDRRRRVTLVVIGSLCALTGIVSGTYNLVTSGPISNVLLPFTFAAVVGSAVLAYFFTKKFGILLHGFLFMILLIPVLFQWSVGGFTGVPGSVTIIFWSILAPVGSLMFQDAKKSVWWFSAYIVLVVISLYLDEHFIGMAVPTSHSKLMVDQGINIIALSITVFLTMLYFVQAFQKEHSRAEKLVLDLTETNRELEATLLELKETQAELVQAEKLSSLGKLAAGIAHEINNPIGALKSAADSSNRCVAKMELSSEKTERDGKLKASVDFRKHFQILRDNNRLLLSAADRVASTVRSFIDFARLDGAEFDKVDINQCIDNTITMIHQELKDGTSVKKEFGNIPKVACYPGEMNQVFWNLLSNSAKAIKGKGTITIRTFAEEGNLHVQIIDTGIGIPPEKVERLFEPEFNKSESRVKAGMGLFTAFNIVQKHRGKIEVKSKVGAGSTFSIIFPANLDEIEGREQ